MKFKLFGIIWDFSYVLGILWVFVGMVLMLSIFVIDKMGWWSIPYFINLLLFAASAQSISEQLATKEKAMGFSLRDFIESLSRAAMTRQDGCCQELAAVMEEFEEQVDYAVTCGTIKLEDIPEYQKFKEEK